MPSTMKAEKPPARSAICSASLAERLAAPDTLLMPPEARICQQRASFSHMQAKRGLLRCLQRVRCWALLSSADPAHSTRCSRRSSDRCFAIVHRFLWSQKLHPTLIALQPAPSGDRVPDIGPDRDPEAHVAGNAAADRPQQEGDRGQDSHGQPAQAYLTQWKVASVLHWQTAGLLMKQLLQSVSLGSCTPVGSQGMLDLNIAPQKSNLRHCTAEPCRIRTPSSTWSARIFPAQASGCGISRSRL